MLMVNDERVGYEPGMTVADVLRKQARPVPMIAVWLDGELVKRDAYERTPVRDGAVLQVVPIIAGG